MYNKVRVGKEGSGGRKDMKGGGKSVERGKKGYKGWWEKSED